MQKKLTLAQVKSFQTKVWAHYRKHGRKLPWRTTRDPYHIVVSEIMLQQTQVARVLVKYPEFLKPFPDWKSLALAPLSTVLTVWQGLGYNRRAKYLHETAKLVFKEFGHEMSKNGTRTSHVLGNFEFLTSLPGIGPNTAGALLAYAFNTPCAFLETNIKAVYIHHCFHDALKVSDKELLPLVEQTMDTKKPREWFNALMDYGVMIKATHGNAANKSKSYTRQTKFKGSKRELRGAILRAYLQNPKLTLRALVPHISRDIKRLVTIKEVREIKSELQLEGML